MLLFMYLHREQHSHLIFSFLTPHTTSSYTIATIHEHTPPFTSLLISLSILCFHSGLYYQIFLISSTQFTFILQSFLFFIFLISHFTHSQLIYLADTFYFNTSPPHLFHKIFTDCKSNSCSFFAVILPISPYKVFGRFSQM